MRVCVLVVGDVGRSPRMCYHALSLAQHGCHVDLLGYHNSALPSPLRLHPNIRMVHLPPVPSCVNHLPSLIVYAIKFVYLTLGLLLALLFRVDRRSQLLLVQNPPGVPTLAVCSFVTKIKKSRMVVDWHNYTFSVLRAQLEERRRPKIVDESKHPLVRLTAALEWRFGGQADLSFSVTRAMRANIEKMCAQRPVVLYDRPPSWKFPTMQLEEKHAFIYRLVTEHYYAPFVCTFKDVNELEATSLSYRDSKSRSIVWRDDRPAVLLSSTSWTVDEDFRLLLDALVEYDDRVCRQGDLNTSAKLPELIAVITGKGPQKDMYLSLMSELDLRHVEILTPWLEPEDYPRMLNCADLGVCLHTSTSGLDLPMKVVDMFGCGMPVLAKHFACINELVNENVNGRTFNDSQQLAEQICDLLTGFPKYSQKLTTMRSSLRNGPLGNWEDNWHSTVWPLLRAQLSPPL